MNKKQKILTVFALVTFGMIIALHYLPVYQHSYMVTGIYPNYLQPGGFTLPPLIEDVRMPLFVLGVFYAGFFFLLHDKK